MIERFELLNGKLSQTTYIDVFANILFRDIVHRE